MLNDERQANGQLDAIGGAMLHAENGLHDLETEHQRVSGQTEQILAQVGDGCASWRSSAGRRASRLARSRRRQFDARRLSRSVADCDKDTGGLDAAARNVGRHRPGQRGRAQRGAAAASRGAHRRARAHAGEADGRGGARRGGAGEGRARRQQFHDLLVAKERKFTQQLLETSIARDRKWPR